MTALESGELNSQHERELRCSEGSGMLIGDPHGEGSNASSTNKGATYHRALGSGKLNSQNERELRHLKGSCMLMGDPLW